MKKISVRELRQLIMQEARISDRARTYHGESPRISDRARIHHGESPSWHNKGQLLEPEKHMPAAGTMFKCPDCAGAGWDESKDQDCEYCAGHGQISKRDMYGEAKKITMYCPDCERSITPRQDGSVPRHVDGNKNVGTSWVCDGSGQKALTLEELEGPYKLALYGEARGVWKTVYCPVCERGMSPRRDGRIPMHVDPGGYARPGGALEGAQCRGGGCKPSSKQTDPRDEYVKKADRIGEAKVKIGADDKLCLGCGEHTVATDNKGRVPKRWICSNCGSDEWEVIEDWRL